MTYGSTNNPTPGAGFQTITTSTQYRYYIIILNITNSAYANVTLMQIQHAAGGYNNLVNGTDYTVTTAISGAPVITYTDSTISNLVYIENTLLLFEAYRRLYPVIHDTTNLFLSGGTG